LLEAVFGLGLAAVVSGIGAVQLPELVTAVRLAGAARTLATTLRLARAQAIAGDAAVEVRFDARGSYDAPAFTVPTVLPVGVRFAALPARRRILFGPLGSAENGTVTLAATAGQRAVVVNQRGRVRVQ
jgi:Tfp pilus assembly protein FimT